MSERDEIVIQATTWVGFANILSEMDQTQVVKFRIREVPRTASLTEAGRGQPTRRGRWVLFNGYRFLFVCLFFGMILEDAVVTGVKM